MRRRCWQDIAHSRFREICELHDPLFDEQMNKENWPAQKRAIAAMFRSRRRDEWVTLLGGDDTCTAPVLDWDEAQVDPHNVARNTFVSIEGVTQPAPAPRFSRTPATVPRSARVSGDDTHEILRKWGLAEPVIDRLRA